MATPNKTQPIDCEHTEYPVCPYCGDELNEPEDYSDHVTYWGDQTIERECPACGLTYEVEEYVSRRFTTKPMVQERKSQAAEPSPGEAPTSPIGDGEREQARTRCPECGSTEHAAANCTNGG